MLGKPQFQSVSLPTRKALSLNAAIGPSRASGRISYCSSETACRPCASSEDADARDIWREDALRAFAPGMTSFAGKPDLIGCFLGQTLRNIASLCLWPVVRPYSLRICLDRASGLATGLSICHSSTSWLSTSRLADLMADASSRQSN